MIRATAGTWISYATTLVFQVLFAARFGSSMDAGGFVLVFALSVSIAGIFVTTATVLILPRLAEPDGRLSGRALRTLGASAIGVGAASLAGIGISLVAGDGIGALLGLPTSRPQTVLALSAVIVGLFGLAGIVGTLALARGRRFVPSAASTLPSAVGALYLAIAGVTTVAGLFAALALGGMLQLIVVGGAAFLPRPQTSAGTPFHPRRQAILTAAALIALSLVAPTQRFAAGSLDVAGVARFDYAARSLQAAQQLLIGGLLVALLPDLSRIADDVKQFSSRVSFTVTAVALLLSAAGLVALAAAPQLVALVFERGAFTEEDTAAVAFLIRLMSAGFVAEGITLVLAQAAFASHRAELAIRVAFTRVGLQLILTIALGLMAGAPGVAVAYTISMLVVAALMGAAFSESFGGRDLLRNLRRGGIDGGS